MIKRLCPIIALNLSFFNLKIQSEKSKTKNTNVQFCGSPQGVTTSLSRLELGPVCGFISFFPFVFALPLFPLPPLSHPPLSLPSPSLSAFSLIPAS